MYAFLKCATKPLNYKKDSERGVSFMLMLQLAIKSIAPMNYFRLLDTFDATVNDHLFSFQQVSGAPMNITNQ